MKRVIICILFTAFLMIFPITAYAADTGEASGVSITVVIPQTEPKKEAPPPEPTTQPPKNYLYPVSVWESQDNGRREIIKTYELAPNEKPQNISRESFTRDGWLYEIADITKKETSSNDMREYTETVTIDTATNDISAILQLLAPEMEYKSNDGYTGILYLDISSIKVETAGTKSSSYTVTATREYPHLSSNDTSLIPKTITDNGRTLTLSNIDWRVQNYTTIDYDRIPDSYTAVATYAGTASKTTVTGYTTTAEYRGRLSKIITGKTVYTAYFIGIPIVTPTIDELENTNFIALETTQEIIPEIIESPIQEPLTESTIEPPLIEIELPIETNPPVEIETESEQETETEPENKEQPDNLVPNILAGLTGAGIAVVIIGGVLIVIYLQNKRKKV